MDYGVLLSNWASLGHEDLPMDCLYISVGAYDNHTDPYNSYLVMRNDSERFNDDNLCFSLFSNTGHEQREWVNAVYNSAQLFFR